MQPWEIILTAAGTSLVGFGAGVRYCARHMMPNLLAKMDDKELHRLAKDAGKLRAKT